MDDPGNLIRATFTPSLRDLLVEALSAAYETAGDHYEPARGSNATTFGLGVYHYAVHEICTRKGGDLTVLSRSPLFRFQVGNFTLACHRVGQSEREDIFSAFPNADSAAHTMVEEQLCFPGMGLDLTNVDDARNLILAHCGNEEDGFRAAYLCVPGRAEGTRLVEWAHVETLWMANQHRAPSQGGLDATVPEETIGEPVVRRKPKKVTDDAENE